VCVGTDQVKEANPEQLQCEFGDITFKASETVEDFTLYLNNVASQLRILSDDISDKEVIKKMLHVVPKKLEQVAIFMDTLLDLNSLLIEEALDHLRAIEQRKKPTPAKESDGHLLLTEEEWMAHMKTKDGSGSNFGTLHGGGNGGVARPGENAGVRRAMTICAPTATRKATGPRSVARRSETRRPRPMWPKEKKRSRAFFWPTTSSMTTRPQPSSALPSLHPFSTDRTSLHHPHRGAAGLC
jgi:hypothetical protein